MEKDYLIENWYRTGSFPADKGVDISPGGKTRRGAGHVETVIKAMHWYEFLQAFMPVSLLALVLYAFYGALPQSIWKAIKGNNNQTLVERFNMLQDNLARSAQQKLLEFAQGGSSRNRRIGANKPIVYQKPAVRGLITQGAHAKTPPTHRTAAVRKSSIKPSQALNKKSNNAGNKSSSQKQISPVQKPKPRQQITMNGTAKPQNSAKAGTKSSTTQPKKLQPKAQNTPAPKKLEPKAPSKNATSTSVPKKPGKVPQPKTLPSRPQIKKLGAKKGVSLPQGKKT